MVALIVQPFNCSHRSYLHQYSFSSAQAVAALACDLQLDEHKKVIESRQLDALQPWFSLFCLAHRTAMAMQNRTTLPAKFCEQVAIQVQLSSPVDVNVSDDFMDNSVFTVQRDEQLLLWLKQ